MIESVSEQWTSAVNGHVLARGSVGFPYLSNEIVLQVASKQVQNNVGDHNEEHWRVLAIWPDGRHDSPTSLCHDTDTVTGFQKDSQNSAV